MRKIIILLLISQMTNSCFLMPLGAPHEHEAKNLTDPNSEIKMVITCLPHDKYYAISGTEANDNIYISSANMEQLENLLSDKTLVNQNTEKVYRLRIGDSNFHRRILNDTVKVKIVKSNSKIEMYKFLVVKDNYLRK